MGEKRETRSHWVRGGTSSSDLFITDSFGVQPFLLVEEEEGEGDPGLQDSFYGGGRDRGEEVRVRLWRFCKRKDP